MVDKRRIGIIGGTFNPIHLGHLMIAEVACESFNLEKVIFVPARIPPHKQHDVIDSHHRYAMTAAAVLDNPNFEISDVEIRREGYGRGKLNSAYALGGPALLEQTVETVTGVRIDGYYEIGFGGFSELVDVVGGVEICPESPMSDELSGLNVPAGCQQIDGTTALAYVRMRYSDPEGDIGRAKRQREITGKVMARIATPSSVLNPFKYWGLGRAGSQMLSRGEKTGLGDLGATVLGLANVSGGEGLSLVVPIETTEGWSDDGQSVVIWNSEQAIQLFDEISRGDTSNLDRFVA